MANQSQASLQFSLLKSFLTNNEHLKDFRSSSLKNFQVDLQTGSEELKVEETGLWTLSDDEEIRLVSEQFAEVRSSSKLRDFVLEFSDETLSKNQSARSKWELLHTRAPSVIETLDSESDC